MLSLPPRLITYERTRVSEECNHHQMAMMKEYLVVGKHTTEEASQECQIKDESKHARYNFPLRRCVSAFNQVLVNKT
jgi:hypothetical protein